MIADPHPMAGKPCVCGRGKASAYDGKCGHCRSRREAEAVNRMRDGWPRSAAQRRYLTKEERMAMSLPELS